MLEERLSRTHAREGDRLHGDCAIGLDARKGGRFQGARVGKVVAVVRTARILARERRLGDDPTDGNQAFEIQPVVPAEIEGA